MAGGLEHVALGFSRGAAWVYEMWRGLSEMVHTTGLEMDGWGSSNSWRMDRPAARAPGWEFWGESRAEPCRAPGCEWGNQANTLPRAVRLL